MVEENKGRAHEDDYECEIGRSADSRLRDDSPNMTCGL